MAELDLKYIFDKENNKLMLYEHRMVTTSLYHNAFMQETVIESGNMETIKLLSRSATESTLTLLKMYFNEHPQISENSEKLKTAGLLYQGLGYGLININNLTEEGGIAEVYHSNVIELLKTKLNKNEDTICYYTNGFILGALSSVFQRNAEYYKIEKDFNFINYGYKLEVGVA